MVQVDEDPTSQVACHEKKSPTDIKRHLYSLVLGI